MQLLFKREQSSGIGKKVDFKLWGKIDLTVDEQEMINRYKLDDAILIYEEQPGLLKWTALVASAAGLATAAVLFQAGSSSLVFGAMAGLMAGYWYYNDKRETIYVRDLMHGRYFKCSSVIDLARKEAWLQTVVAFLRQVMESSKHWDGTESHPVEALSPEEARQVIIQGL